MTRVAFTGVHGIGKSQTCIKINKVLPEYLYIPSFAGPVAKKMGFDLNRTHSLDQLYAYQDRVLETFIESYKATSRMDTIYDRSPIDIAAYLYTGTKHLANTREFYRTTRFVSKCLQATRDYTDILIYPEADFTTPIQAKDNRPTDDDGLYNRREFDKLIDSFVDRVKDKVRVIDVPVSYQYDDRVNYILASI